MSYIHLSPEQIEQAQKYALSDILYSEKCGTPCRRCTQTKKGKKIVWRCISRLDYGTKYCKKAPSIEETIIQNAICEAIAKIESVCIDRILGHIAMYQSNRDTSNILAKQERLKAIQERINELTDMNSESAQNGDFDEHCNSRSVNYIGLANLGYKLFVNFGLEHEHNQKNRDLLRTEIKQEYERLLNESYTFSNT